MENTPRRKIILVDDVKFTLVSTKNRLKSFYEIYTAQSAAKLFEIIENFIPDLILLDINMPDINGYEVLKILKSNPRFAGIPVIFLTADSSKDSVMKGLNIGATDHVSKPFSVPFLQAHIEGIFNPSQRNTLAQELEPDEDSNKPCILAIDDSAPMLRSIHYALRDKYKVYTLPKPENLKDILSRIKPDLFLVDCNMPALSGFELIPIIRKYPEYKETPIVFLTAEGSTSYLSTAMAHGANDFIVKPFNTKAFRERIENHIKKNKPEKPEPEKPEPEKLDTEEAKLESEPKKLDAKEAKLESEPEKLDTEETKPDEPQTES